MQATTFASSYIENFGEFNFAMSSLPNYAQVSPILTMKVLDIDSDGINDIIVAGNLYDLEIESPRMDSGIGLLLKGDGKGNFNSLTAQNSGLYIMGNVKKTVFIEVGEKKEKAILAAINNGNVRLVKLNNSN